MFRLSLVRRNASNDGVRTTQSASDDPEGHEARDRAPRNELDLQEGGFRLQVGGTGSETAERMVLLDQTRTGIRSVDVLGLLRPTRPDASHRGLGPDRTTRTM